MSKYTAGPDINLDTEVVKGKNGKRITEAGAEKLARQALRKAGRPSLSGGAKHSPPVSFRVSPKLAQRVDAVAKERGVSRSVIAREALEKYVS